MLKAALGVMTATLWGGIPAYADEERMTTTTKSYARPSVLTYDDVRAVSPALEHYTKSALPDGLWQRPELSRRDRSIVTVAALIARIQTIEMPLVGPIPFPLCPSSRMSSKSDRNSNGIEARRLEK